MNDPRAQFTADILLICAARITDADKIIRLGAVYDAVLAQGRFNGLTEAGEIFTTPKRQAPAEPMGQEPLP